MLALSDSPTATASNQLTRRGQPPPKLSAASGMAGGHSDFKTPSVARSAAALLHGQGWHNTTALPTGPLCWMS